MGCAKTDEGVRTMTTLKHDAAGFLIGDPLDLGKAVSLLETIRSDVRAMRQAMEGASGATPRASVKADRAPVVAVPNRGHSAAAKAENIAAVNRQMAAMAKASRAAAIPGGRGRLVPGDQQRDGSGRFVSGSGSAAPSINADGLTRRIASAVAAGVSGSEEADPTIKAFKEVAEPLKRGYKSIFGDRDEKKKDGWLRRIWSELRNGRVEQTAYEKAAAKSLKAIENKPVGGAQGGGGIPGIPTPEKSWIPPAAAGGLGGVLARAASFVGRLGVAAAPLLAMWKVADWSGDTSHDKERVEGIQNNVAEPLKAGLKTVGIDKDAEIEAIREKNRREQNGSDEYERMDRAKAALAAEGLKPGTPAYDAKLGTVYQGLEQQDAEAKKGRVAKAWDKAKSAGGWILGQTSKMFESGKGGAGTVSNGKGDAGGASYGTYQLSSKAGTLDKFLSSTKYGAEFAGLQPGTPEFKAKWKEIAAKDSEFGTAQHDFIKATHFDPQMAKLQGAGIDLSGRGAAVQDAIWSTAVQFGGNSSLIQKALKGKDVSSLSDQDVVSAIQDYKTANNDALFKSSSADVRAGTLDRATKEKTRLLALAESSQAAFWMAPSAMKVPQVATASLPRIPPMPAAPTIPDAPTIQVPLSSLDAGRNITVTPPPTEHGQDLSNRRLAHIVTGGYSGGLA